MLDFLRYLLTLILSTLGVFFLCGLTVHLIARAFSALMGRGSGAVFDVTSVIGTPVHELGHAAMCKLFCHKITRMKLWNPRPENGVYGFVEHSYSKRNLWARFGNLFIGMGPLFSGLGVTVLTLWLCFPSLWEEYLQASAFTANAPSLTDVFADVFLLFKALPRAFASSWLKSLLGLVIILPVSLHISMSPQDIKGSLGALLPTLVFLVLFALATFFTGIRAPIASALLLFSCRLLSLFALVIGFSLLWLLFALLIRGVKIFISWF